MEKKPDLERVRPHLGGTQKIYRFPNGFGASVVQGIGTYGNEEGLWELAVVKFKGDGLQDSRLCYDTPITDDVIGYLTKDAVEETLCKIEALEQSDATTQT